MTATHEELVRVAAALPEERAQQVLNFARILSALPAGADYQDFWTEEDMRDATRASMLRFDAEHPDEDWGIDYAQLLKDRECSPPET